MLWVFHSFFLPPFSKSPFFFHGRLNKRFTGIVAPRKIQPHKLFQGINQGQMLACIDCFEWIFLSSANQVLLRLRSLSKFCWKCRSMSTKIQTKPSNNIFTTLMNFLFWVFDIFHLGFLSNQYWFYFSNTTLYADTISKQKQVHYLQEKQSLESFFPYIHECTGPRFSFLILLWL